MSDARRLQVFEPAREHWGEGPVEALMELVVPAGQDMATKADIDGLMTRIDRRIDGVEARIDGVEVHMQGLATKG